MFAGYQEQREETQKITWLSKLFQRILDNPCKASNIFQVQNGT